MPNFIKAVDVRIPVMGHRLNLSVKLKLNVNKNLVTFSNYFARIVNQTKK